MISTYVKQVVVLRPAPQAAPPAPGSPTTVQSRERKDESRVLGETFEIAGSDGLTFTNESLLLALDLMSRQMEDARPDDDDVVFSPGMVKFTGVIATTLVITWILRAGLLLSSLLASMPLWTMFDPLPVVLSTNESVRRRKMAMQEGEEQDEEEFGSLLEPGSPTTQDQEVGEED